MRYADNGFILLEEDTGWTEVFETGDRERDKTIRVLGDYLLGEINSKCGEHADCEITIDVRPSGKD